MSSRNYYNVTYRHEICTSDSDRMIDSSDVLDNATEFNANQFKLYDDFTTDLRIVNFSSLRSNMYHNIGEGSRSDFGTRSRIGDPNDSGVDMENGNPIEENTPATIDSDLLENEVMVDPWSSMDSNSPLTDSGPSASDDCTPSTSSEPPRDIRGDKYEARRNPEPTECKSAGSNRVKEQTKIDKARPCNLPLNIDHTTHRSHFLDEDYQSPSRSNIECRIPKPHFLDSPSPVEFDERSDITNPNFLDDEAIDDQNTHKKAGALPKRLQKIENSNVSTPEERPHRTNFRSTLHYGLENAARTSERDKRTSQLYQGTWPGEREIWTGHDTASVRSFSSNGSTDATRPSSNLENKMECVYNLLSLLTLSPDNNADLSGPLLEMSRSVESCIAMRQAGCIPLLVQLIHSKLARETRDRAAKALRNIIHTQTDDKAGRREARVWRLLEQVREYCYILEDLVESRKETKDLLEDDANKHPSQCVAALMKLSFDEEHRHVVCQLGGLQALAALVSGDQAAHGSRTDDSTCLTMRRYAGMTLTNLTFGDGNNKSLLCSFKDFMMALVEQLESLNDDMLQVTAAVLRNLSWRADTNSKQILREVGAVKGLTVAAMTCQKETTLKSVLSALWNLTAHCSMNKVALCSVEGALGFLVDMLSYNSPSKTLAIIENAGGIMRNVSSHIAVREDYRQILRERNCLGVLLQHLKSPSLTVVSNSCGTLWNLSARCPQDQQYLWDHGAVPMLRSLIHSKHKMIAMGSSAALKNLLNSKPGKSHIISLDSTARNMNLPALPTLGVRKQKALEQELDQNLAETCDNIEPATSPSTSNREEKNLYSATERQIAMNLERHRMTSSSPLMGALQSQISLSHSAHIAGYLSCSNTLLKGALVSRSTNGSSNNVNRSDSKDSVTSTHSDSVFERATRTGKVPIPTPRNKDLVKSDPVTEVFNVASEPKDSTSNKYPAQPPVPTPRSTAELRTNYAESGYDVDQDACDQPIDYSQKYSETKANPNEPAEEKTEACLNAEPKKYAKKGTFGDYQETDLDQPTDYSLRYAEHQSEVGSDSSEPPAPSVNEDTIKHFCTEGTPYETPIIFSTATSMSDLRVIGPKEKPKQAVKENPEIMTHSDEKDTCSIEETPRHDNDKGLPSQPNTPKVAEKTVFDTKFSSGMISPEKPVNYCEEGTPGYFSRVSSLSSLGDPTEEDSLAKKNAKATIHVTVVNDESTHTVKDKEGSKAVTFACEPTETPPEPAQPPFEEQPNTNESGFVLETPLMFSRSSSMGSMAENQDEVVSVVSAVSEISRLTSCCVSPSDIPDSPAHSVIHSPARSITAPSTPPQPEHGSVFEERVSHFIVENTPAHFSTATSLSELTIPDDKSLLEQLDEACELDDNVTAESDIGHHYDEREDSIDGNQMVDEPLPCAVPKNIRKVTTLPIDSCRVYHTEDTPAIFSNLGSNSNLSALSVESGPTLAPVHDTSDSSNLSDSADLLEQCIQKGIDRVVKNKGQSSESSSAAGIKPIMHRGEVYHSLPPYLRSSTETVKLPHEASRLVHDKSSSVSPPPPLPPKSSSAVAPPRPPNSQLHTLARKHESRLPVKSQRNTKERPKPHSNLARNDSLSSLSLDSFGSTDREIFEETVKAGLSSVNRRANYASESKEKAHSVERPSDNTRHNARHHKSLDRSDIISQHKTKLRDVEFERNLASGAYNLNSSSRFKKYDNDCMTRSPYSYHGDTAAHSLSHHSRWSKHSRFHDDGPPSLPARIDTRLERSNSLSSLSNDSFGSTDKEVFERAVRVGMSKHNEKKGKNEEKLRVRSDDRLEAREHRSRRRRIEPVKPLPPPGALDKMLGEEYSKDRAILEEMIAKGAGEKPNAQSKNVLAPFGARARDGPPSLPARIDARLERSNSLSSLSNDSFGSTDKEVFERTVRVGMSKHSEKKGKNEEKLRVRSDDRLEAREHRSRRRRTEPVKPLPPPGALDKMLGEEYSKDRAILEEMIAKGAGEKPNAQSKNVPAPSVARAPADGNADLALNTTTGSETDATDIKQSPITHSDTNTMFESAANEMERSNEFLAPKSNNTTLESIKDELDRSNESYADVLDGSFSDVGSLHKNDTGTIKRQNRNNLEWTTIKVPTKPFNGDDELSKRADDTWNDNTCPDDVTFPTISGSIHMVASIRSELGDATSALPDLLETSDIASVGPDLTNKLYDDHLSNASRCEMKASGHRNNMFLDSIPEPSFTSLLDDSEPKYNSLMSSAIEKEAARLAAQLKISQYTMDTSVTSLTSLDLNNIKPPSDLGGLLSLSTSGQWDESASQTSKKSQKNRKISLPVALMVKRALSNSMHLGSSEHLDSNPASFLDNVKPPSEMDQIDLESSMISVSSIGSEVVEREKTPVVFDLKQPIQDFPLCNNFTMLQDIEKINPPSLFEEICESTIEMEPTTAQPMFDDCISNTLNVVTDIPSCSENCTPLPSDVSSVESTPKRKCLTPKERRQIAKDRYQTYTIIDSVTESTDVVLEVDSEDFLTWTKSESDSRSDDYVTATSEPKTKRKLTAKQRRQEDRARYQTQTVNIGSLLAANSAVPKVEDLNQSVDAKRTIKQKRLEDAERYKTRTLSGDIPPSPTFIIKDVNLENIETTTGYDSLSSNELNHHIDEARHNIDTSRDIDSGHNDDDYETNSSHINPYTSSYKNYIPVVESPTTTELCVVNNLKNIEMTASYQRALEQRNNPSTSDFASFEGESDHSDSDIESPIVKAKPKIIKPESRRDESVDSNESLDNECSKGIRGRKKASYVSPYRRNVVTKSSEPITFKPVPSTSKPVAQVKKVPVKTATKSLSSNTSPKKTVPVKTIQKASTVKPLPLERQGTFTKETTVALTDLPVADKKLTKTTKNIPKVNTSPSRLPQPSTSKFGLTKPAVKKVADKPQVKKLNRSSYPTMKNSASNHSLQSNDSGKTITLTSRTTSRQGSTSSINSVTSKNNVESKIANLWKKVEQSKKQPSKPDKRVWIGAEPETPKLIRSSTFDSPPKLPQATTAKQQSSIAIRSSGIPSLRPKSSPAKCVSQLPKKPATARSAFSRKPVNGQS